MAKDPEARNERTLSALDVDPEAAERVRGGALLIPAVQRAREAARGTRRPAAQAPDLEFVAPRS